MPQPFADCFEMLSEMFSLFGSLAPINYLRTGQNSLNGVLCNAHLSTDCNERKYFGLGSSMSRRYS